MQVALKVQKSAPHYTEAAMDEIEFLQKCATTPGRGNEKVVRLVDYFRHAGPNGTHVCMVFEPMGPNLLSLIKQYKYRGIPIEVVKSITKQVLMGLDFIHTKCSIIHTDLKPENVLLSASEGEFADDLEKLSETLSVGSVASLGVALTKSQKRRQREKKRKAKAKAIKAHGAESGGCADSKDGGEGEEGEDASETPAVGSVVGSRTVSGSPTKSGDVEDDAVGGSSAESPAGTKPSSANSSVIETILKGKPWPSKNTVLSNVTAENVGAKIVDLGNACYTNKHFTDDIQTRQYRSPEVLLGSKYDTSADMWSVACMVFELVTGDLLFDPHEGDGYDRDEDHLAQFQELLGRIPRSIALTGKYSLELFNRKVPPGLNPLSPPPSDLATRCLRARESMLSPRSTSFLRGSFATSGSSSSGTSRVSCSRSTACNSSRPAKCCLPLQSIAHPPCKCCS